MSARPSRYEGTSRGDRLLVDLHEPAPDVVPGVALDRDAARPCAERGAARLVLQQTNDSFGERPPVACREGDGGSFVMTSR